MKESIEHPDVSGRFVRPEAGSTAQIFENEWKESIEHPDVSGRFVPPEAGSTAQIFENEWKELIGHPDVSGRSSRQRRNQRLKRQRIESRRVRRNGS